MRASSSSPRFAETPVETFHLSAFQFKIRNFIAPRESERGDDAFISRIKVMGASSRARVHVIYIRSRQIAPALIFHAELAPPPTPPLLLLHSFLLFLGAGDVKCRGLRGRPLLCKFGRDILRNCILVWELSREKEQKVYTHGVGESVLYALERDYKLRHYCLIYFIGARVRLSSIVYARMSFGQKSRTNVLYKIDDKGRGTSQYFVLHPEPSPRARAR